MQNDGAGWLREIAGRWLRAISSPRPQRFMSVPIDRVVCEQPQTLVVEKYILQVRPQLEYDHCNVNSMVSQQQR